MVRAVQPFGPDRIRRYYAIKQQRQQQDDPQSGQWWAQDGWEKAPRRVADHYRREAEKIVSDPRIPDEGRMELLGQLAREAKKTTDEAVAWRSAAKRPS